MKYYVPYGMTAHVAGWSGGGRVEEEYPETFTWIPGEQVIFVELIGAHKVFFRLFETRTFSPNVLYQSPRSEFDYCAVKKREYDSVFLESLYDNSP